ncbi:hypothetical protein T01_8379 [Trichinella spiralis]|uniref:Uncharacterized protein n=1 Tax=Trichinella spiralis TaxID=6334 RepID=A0A0V1BN24_TRISP|nr:hypothetical protein T01_8379 [Trichinella spiralis]
MFSQAATTFRFLRPFSFYLVYFYVSLIALNINQIRIAIITLSYLTVSISVNREVTYSKNTWKSFRKQY